MLVAGHETTGSVLTWTLYLLANNPTQMRKVSQAVGGNDNDDDKKKKKKKNNRDNHDNHHHHSINNKITFLLGV